MKRKVHENSLKNLSPGSPGRKKGGRAEVIRMIDDLLIEKQDQVKQYFYDEFNRDIGNFLKVWVYNLLPKDVNLTLTGDDENPIIIMQKVDNGNNGKDS